MTLGAGLVLALGSSAAAGSSIPWMPENISPGGEKIDHIFFVILVLTGLTFVLTEAVLIYTMIKFRYKPGHKADHVHGHHRLETVWTVGTGLILLFLALYQIPTWNQLKMSPPAGENAVQVQVLAEQFKFHFRYAGLDGAFGTPDDVMQIAELHVPADKDVILTMRSKDVIHSLFLPHVRFKQDVLPGTTIQSWFRAQKTTAAARAERDDESFDYEIACAELCGNSHYTMRGILVVHEPGEFEEWIKAESTAAVDYAPPEVWEHWDKSVAKDKIAPAGPEH
jgi:cytochrome c oxidase subunit 2